MVVTTQYPLGYLTDDQELQQPEGKDHQKHNDKGYSTKHVACEVYHHVGCKSEHQEDEQ